MNERQRIQAEPQVQEPFRSGREKCPTSKDRIAESTTSLAQREPRHFCLMSRDVATSAARLRMSSRSFGRDPIDSASWGYANHR